MRSSVLPVARMILEDSWVWGESARQRIAEAWALKRKVSEKVTLGLESLEVSSWGGASSCPVTRF